MDPYEVQIKTTADPTGADEAKAALAGVGNEAAAINERSASLARQKEEITVAQLKALQAEALGENEVAVALQREVALRTAALRLQQESNITEAEAVAIAEARAVAEDKVYGKAGKFKLLQNLGVDTNTAKTLGIAALAGFQLQQYIEEAAKYYDDLRITGEKESVELEKQVQSWKEMAASARDLNDVAKLQESITRSVAEQQEKIRQLPAEGTKGFYQNAYDSAQTYNNWLLELYGSTKRMKTSTDEAVDSVNALADTEQSTGAVFVKSAQGNLAAVRAIIALPYAEAIEKARTEIARLTNEQESLNRSDKKQEQDWQRKQSQINTLSSAIAQLADRHELLARKEQLEGQVATATDPAKRASAQKELDDLVAKLLIQDQIQKATEKAALSQKSLGADERKAIEDQLKPLEAKLRILRELIALQPARAAEYQQDINKLLDVKPPTGTDTLKQIDEKIIADVKSSVAEREQAKARLALILQDELRAIDKTTPPPVSSKSGAAVEPITPQARASVDAAVKSAGEIDGAIIDSAGQIKASIDASVAQIKPAFDPVAEAMNQIPDAVTQGAAQIVSTVGSIASAMRSELSKLDQDLQRQIDAIWQNI